MSLIELQREEILRLYEQLEFAKQALEEVYRVAAISDGTMYYAEVAKQALEKLK